jgi:hypothetical protein
LALNVAALQEQIDRSNRQQVYNYLLMVWCGLLTVATLLMYRRQAARVN